MIKCCECKPYDTNERAHTAHVCLQIRDPQDQAERQADSRAAAANANRTTATIDVNTINDKDGIITEYIYIYTCMHTYTSGSERR